MSRYTSTTETREWVLLDKDGDVRYEARTEADARDEAVTYRNMLPHDAPYRVVRRITTIIDEEVPDVA